MKLKKHGALLVNFVIDFANGDMSREDFDMDYSGYVIECILRRRTAAGAVSAAGIFQRFSGVNGKG